MTATDNANAARATAELSTEEKLLAKEIWDGLNVAIEPDYAREHDGGIEYARYIGQARSSFADYERRFTKNAALLARHDDEVARLTAFVEELARFERARDAYSKGENDARETIAEEARDLLATLRPASADADGQREDGTP